jgi:hypothetical protein
MNADELREAAEAIGLAHRGQSAQLLAVYPERGAARIVVPGWCLEVPVAELRWNEPTRGRDPR